MSNKMYVDVVFMKKPANLKILFTSLFPIYKRDEYFVGYKHLVSLFHPNLYECPEISVIIVTGARALKLYL